MWLRFPHDSNQDRARPRCHVPVCSPLCCTAIKCPQQMRDAAQLLHGRGGAESTDILKVLCMALWRRTAMQCGCHPISHLSSRLSSSAHTTLLVEARSPESSPADSGLMTGPLFCCSAYAHSSDLCVFLLPDLGAFQPVATQRLASGAAVLGLLQG